MNQQHTRSLISSGEAIIPPPSGPRKLFGQTATGVFSEPSPLPEARTLPFPTHFGGTEFPEIPLVDVSCPNRL